MGGPPLRSAWRPSTVDRGNWSTWHAAPDAADTRQWLREFAVEVINVAGPRESTSPGIYQASHAFLVSIFRPGVLMRKIE